jgi:hypothetical protein
MRNAVSADIRRGDCQGVGSGWQGVQEDALGVVFVIRRSAGDGKTIITKVVALVGLPAFRKDMLLGKIQHLAREIEDRSEVQASPALFGVKGVTQHPSKNAVIEQQLASNSRACPEFLSSNWNPHCHQGRLGFSARDQGSQ